MSDDSLIAYSERERELWYDLVQIGVEVSGNKLSENSSEYLVSTFMNTLKDKKLIDGAVATMYSEANQLEGTLRANALKHVGNISLMRAGFIPLVSKHFKRTIGTTTPYFISCGRSSFYGAKLTYESTRRYKTAEVFEALVEEFVLLVEVIWALRKNGYPELIELFEVSILEGARHSKEKVKEHTQGFILGKMDN